MFHRNHYMEQIIEPFKSIDHIYTILHFFPLIFVYSFHVLLYLLILIAISTST